MLYHVGDSMEAPNLTALLSFPITPRDSENPSASSM